MAVQILILQHAECETIGSIQPLLLERNISFQVVRVFDGEPTPANLDAASGLIVMGGPMGVYDYDRFPWLRQELALIESALKVNRPVLGVCLGSQLLASVMGANVRPSGSLELGWHSVELTPQGLVDPLWKGISSPFTAFHWHGDIFELPAQAEPLAASKQTVHQAFRVGTNAYGLLFHLEVTNEIVRQIATTFSADLAKVSLAYAQVMEETERYLPQLQNVARPVFNRWLDLLKDRG